MHTAIVELNPLSDSVWTAAKNHHFFRGVALDLIVASIVSGIIIWRIRLELRRARIHEPITWNKPELFAQGTNFILRLSGKIPNLAVGKSERFGFGQQFLIHFVVKIRQSKPDDYTAGKLRVAN